jgi:hypothetical protein
MDPPYDVTRRLQHAREALDHVPIGHPMFRHLNADVNLHERMHALARLPPDYWAKIPESSIRERIDTLVDGDWNALMHTRGDRALSDRVQYESEWLLRCIITAARVRDGDETNEQFDAYWAQHNAEVEHEQRMGKEWGSSYYHTGQGGRRLRTPDAMLHDRSPIRYSSYAHEIQDRLKGAEEAGRRRHTRGTPSDPQWDQIVAEDTGLYSAQLQQVHGAPRIIPPSQYGVALEEIRHAWYELLERPRDGERQQRVQLLTDQMLLAFGP